MKLRGNNKMKVMKKNGWMQNELELIYQFNVHYLDFSK